jgi:hypothetical protein
LNIKGQQITNDSEIINDTVIVYDTVWEYEIVYDTVWIIDTVVVDDVIIDSFDKIIPKKINYLLFSAGYSLDAEKKIITETYKRKTKPVKRSKYYKFRYDLKHKKKTTSNSKKRKTQTVTSVTLNPFKGKFDSRVFSRGIYSIDGYYGFISQSTQYSGHEDIVNFISSYTDMNGYEYGIKLNYNLFQYGIQTGMGIMNLKEKFDYIKTDYLVDSTKQSETISYTKTVTDTIMFIDIDKLLDGDTVWIEYYDTYDTVIVEDSVYYSYDTTVVNQEKSNIISHQLFEIPLIFTYDWSFGKTTIQLKLGGVNQFHLFSKGKIKSIDGTIDQVDKIITFTKYNFALYGGIGFLYDITNRWAVATDIYYKYPLCSFAETEGIIFTKQTFGINFSIKFRLNIK